MTAPDIPARKAALRTKMRALRATLDPALGALLAEHVLASDIVPPRAIIAGFWPMPHEIDIRPLLHALHERGHQLCLPETTKPGTPLIFRAWTPGAEMIQGRYNTQHPTGPQTTPNFLLIPLLAFDAKGNRLGCAFAAQEVAEVPTENTDLRLHAVATELCVAFTE